MIFQALKQTSLAITLLLFFATTTQAQLRQGSLPGERLQLDLQDQLENGPDGQQVEMFIPNAFTPNADGINDVFSPIYEGEINDYSLVIFDRYGRQVFSADNMNAAWDGRVGGKSLHSGVYIYGITYMNEEGEQQTHSGSITLLK